MEEVILVAKVVGGYVVLVLAAYILVRVITLAVLRSARDVKKERSRVDGV